MAIPVSYNLRNLVVRKTTTIMTALGIALTVAVLLAMMALLGGLHKRGNSRRAEAAGHAEVRAFRAAAGHRIE